MYTRIVYSKASHLYNFQQSIFCIAGTLQFQFMNKQRKTKTLKLNKTKKKIPHSPINIKRNFHSKFKPPSRDIHFKNFHINIFNENPWTNIIIILKNIHLIIIIYKRGFDILKYYTLLLYLIIYIYMLYWFQKKFSIFNDLN